MGRSHGLLWGKKDIAQIFEGDRMGWVWISWYLVYIVEMPCTSPYVQQVFFHYHFPWLCSFFALLEWWLEKVTAEDPFFPPSLIRRRLTLQINVTEYQPSIFLNFERLLKNPCPKFWNNTYDALIIDYYESGII